jgi:hypothetical protein
MGCGDSKQAHNYPKEVGKTLDENERQLKAGNITQKEHDEKKAAILNEFCVGAQGKW